MSLIPRNAVQANWKLRFYPKTASVAFAANSLVDWPASPTGYFVAATSSTTKFCGLLQKATAATDSDFALNTRLPVLVPISGSESTIVATTASAVASDAGLRCDLTDAVTVNRGASSVGRFLITKFISATSVEGYLLGPAEAAAA